VIDIKKLTLLIEINGKTLVVGGRAADTDCKLCELSGIESATVSISTLPFAQSDGSEITGLRLESRTVQIEAQYHQKSSTELQRQWLVSFFNPHHDVKLTVIYAGISRYVNCKIRAFYSNQKNMWAPLNFSIDLFSADPYFLDSKENEINMAEKIPQLTAPFAIPRDKRAPFSVRKFQYEVTLTNGGDVSAGLRVEFRARGDVLNPRLDNLSTGEYLRVLTPMVAGDVLLITTMQGRKRIELNGVNISNLKDRMSSFFQLPVGKSTLKYSADAGYSRLDVFPRFTQKYLGV